MYHREYPITPTQQAANGALDIFVEGCRKNNVPQMLFGLSVLHSATEAQVHAAIPFVHARQGVSIAEIEASLSRVHYETGMYTVAPVVSDTPALAGDLVKAS